MICELQRSRTSTRLLPAVSAAVLCIILMLGLWPFHAPPNDFSWLGNRNGLHFGRFSTAFSSNEFRMTPALDRTSGSLEIWLQPDRISDVSAFLTFYILGNPSARVRPVGASSIIGPSPGVSKKRI